MRSLLTTLFLLKISAAAWAGGPVVRTILTAPQMAPGDANTLKINVLGAADGAPDSLSLAPFEQAVGRENILKKSGWQRSGDGWGYSIQFTFFEEGEVELPALPFNFRPPVGGSAVLETAPKTLRVVAEQVADTTSLRDIKDIHREPTSWVDHLPLILSIGAVLLAAALFLFYKSRKNRGAANPQSAIRNPQSPWEWAFKQLDILEKKGLDGAGGPKGYHTELTETLRGYCSRRFGIAAFKKTSGEILAALESTDGFPKELSGPLARLFETVDLVKFARAEPPDDFHVRALAGARELVRSTIQNDAQPADNQQLETENGSFQRRVRVAFNALPNREQASVLEEVFAKKHAPPARRVAAGAIDLLVWLGGSVGIARLVWALLDLLPFSDDGKSGSGAIALLLSAALVGFGYFFHVFLERLGATPGKVAFSLRTADESGSPMTVGQARRRAAHKLNPAFWGLNGLRHGPKFQTGYDLEAATVVVLRERSGA